MSFKNDYKVSEDTVKSPVKFALENDKKQLELMLSRELNSKEDAYENIIEMERFLSYPHDNLPDTEQKIYEKYDAIKKILGEDILNRGIEISNYDKTLHEMIVTMNVKTKGKIKNEIINNPNLANRLSYLRYHPEVSNKQKGAIVEYQAVYSDMVDEARTNDNAEKISNNLATNLLIDADKVALDTMLNRELNSKEDAYENIIEMKKFLSYPHAHISDADDKINEKLEAIRNILGQDVLEKGLEISSMTKDQHDSFVTMPFEERLKCEKEILENPDLAEQLSYLRYHPEISMKQSGPEAMIEYKAVYSNMVEEKNANEYRKAYEEKLAEKNENSKNEQDNNESR